MKKFIVLSIVSLDSSLEKPIYIINAKDNEEAILKYVESHVIYHELFFLEEVYSIGMYYGFSEQFYNNPNDDLFDENNKIRKDITDEYVNKCFKKNVKEYFSPHDEYAEIYFTFYENINNEYQKAFDRDTDFTWKDAMNKYPLPKDVLVFIGKKEIDSGDILIFNIEELPTI